VSALFHGSRKRPLTKSESDGMFWTVGFGADEGGA
jgi:hypothetical protein